MPINPLERIQASYDTFTKTDLEIADFIINNPRDAARMTPDAIAHETKVSKSAFIRFAKKIGYSGYSEFRFDLSRLLIGDTKHARKENNEENSLDTITDLYAQYIKNIASHITVTELNQAADLILNAQRIKVVGKNRTFNSALQFRQRMSKLGLDSEAMYDSVLYSDAVGILGPKDLYIIFTTNNNTQYDKVVADLYIRKCPILVFTMRDDLPFKKKCAQIITLPRISSNSTVSFLDDQAIYFVFIEVLLNVIASKLSDKEI